MWLYVPASTSSAFAQGGVGSISASSWQFQTLAASCWWRGKRGQPQHWYRRWKHALWLRHLCGAMSKPSTAAHGVAWWMASLAASRANLTASPAASADSTTNATCGHQPVASSRKQDRGSSSSKMSAACSRRGMTKSLAPKGFGETYSGLVSRLRSDCLQRQKSARAMSASACSSSLWPTSTARDWRSDSSQMSDEELYGTKGRPLSRAAMNWPTPDACVMNDGESPETWFARQAQVKAKGINGNGMGLPLTMAAQIWSTPRATDGEKVGPNQNFGAGGIPLPAQAQQWATPCARDFMPAHTEEYIAEKKSQGHGMKILTDQATQWSTPSVADTTGSRKTRSGDRSDEPLLNGQAEIVSLRSILPDLPISTVGEESSHIRRTLNPLFVEWLMGWLPGWTSLALMPPASSGYACSATALFHYKQRMRSALLQLALPEPPLVQHDLFG